jgi:hypothetical protein
MEGLIGWREQEDGEGKPGLPGFARRAGTCTRTIKNIFSAMKLIRVLDEIWKCKG